MHTCQRNWLRFQIFPEVAWWIHLLQVRITGVKRIIHSTLTSEGWGKEASISNCLSTCCNPSSNIQKKNPRCDHSIWLPLRSSQMEQSVVFLRTMTDWVTYIMVFALYQLFLKRSRTYSPCPSHVLHLPFICGKTLAREQV